MRPDDSPYPPEDSAGANADGDRGKRKAGSVASEIAIIVIELFNCVVLFFLSLLAATGGVNFLYVVWLVGYGTIALSTWRAIVLNTRGWGAAGIVLAAVTLPALWLVASGATIAEVAFETLRPNSSEFKAACADVGAKYLAQPATPVRSVAWDWAPGMYPPQVNHYTIDSRGNMGAREGGAGPRSALPESILYTESRCCRFHGRPTKGVGPYLYDPREGEYEGREQLSADAVVQMQVVPIPTDDPEARLERLELEVIDRRDGHLLATFRGVVDQRRRRACGETSPGLFDEREFVYRAVGAL